MGIRQYIYESTQYIHSNYEENLSVADIATQVHLSPSYFAAAFRQHTGYTVKVYLNAVRLYRAAKMLQDSKVSITEIAHATGFSSQQLFTRNFSQMYGMSPTKFRAKCPEIKPFSNPNIFKEKIMSNEYQAIFDNVRIEHKEKIYVVGIECDIDYNAKDGTNPIGDLWTKWNEEILITKFANRIENSGKHINELGITHGETADGTAKYMIGVYVESADDVPDGMVCREFPASDYAVFSATLEQIWTGKVWWTFYHHWLPNSGYTMQDKQFRNYPTSTEYPIIELYDENSGGVKGTVHLYAPVRKV